MKNPYRLVVGILAIGLATFGAYAIWPNQPEQTAVQGTQDGSAPSGVPGATWPPALPPEATVQETQPLGLSGTLVPDGLQVESAGHLVRSRRVRDVFDYFLAAANERSQVKINLMVRDHIATRLQPPAQ